MSQHHVPMSQLTPLLGATTAQEEDGDAYQQKEKDHEGEGHQMVAHNAGDALECTTHDMGNATAHGREDIAPTTGRSSSTTRGVDGGLGGR